jgi:hypothetical protein
MHSCPLHGCDTNKCSNIVGKEAEETITNALARAYLAPCRVHLATGPTPKPHARHSESSDAIPGAITSSALTEATESIDTGCMDQASGQAESNRRTTTHSGPASTSETAVPHGTSWSIGHMMSQCQRAGRADHMAEREAIAPAVEKALNKAPHHGLF